MRIERTMARVSVSGGLWQKLIAVQIYGANTGVGKTVFSTLLGAHFGARSSPTKWTVRYIKPVSTGPADEADDDYVRRYSGSPVSTLFKFNDAVSPHVAARGASHVPSDDHLNQELAKCLQQGAGSLPLEQADMGLAIVETAGGVLSPGPSGTPQADIFRALRLPAVLVGDHRLGGIAATISAAESLAIRGYDIDAVVCFENQSRYENAVYLKQYFEERSISTFDIPWIPDLDGLIPGTREEEAVMRQYYDARSREKHVSEVARCIIDRHATRMGNLESMASRTKQAIWHPFTQHKHVTNAEDVLVFDSAYGDYFQVKETSSSKHSDSALFPALDGSASWWTQGYGHGNPQLSLAAAYAAGRYGHVMFAGAIHQPALELAETMLKRLDNPRLNKVFYTDNGSTATEVGIKMALRAACKHYDWDGSNEEVGVLGLKASYHGDTIGAMDASEPCVFNEKVDWYRGRGFWFDYPTYKMVKGRWVVEPPEGMEEDLGPVKHFDSQDEIFNLDARSPSLRYETYIVQTLDKLVKERGAKFGALIMEPIVLGAGGMIFVDPLFQQSLLRVVRRYDFGPAQGAKSTLKGNEDAWSGIPVVFDEVFTGLYRLGRFSSGSFLGVHPDISVHAKLLTGGLLPLSITTASDSIFQAFWGDEKSEALLHGHSYTAHAVGCQVANVSLEIAKKMQKSEEWSTFRKQWEMRHRVHVKDGCTGGREEKGLWSMWSQDFVIEVSKHRRVAHVNALGSVLAVSLVDSAGCGYNSSASVGLRDALLKLTSEDQIRIHSRILGNVIYLMASMTAKPTHLKAVEETFVSRLKEVL
ncbi:pyridoxal phosphate-dependent transferase [Ampelomyces quisqualis]|uniref:Pyridoxal phosphate-dependent transferase n=1 Tax=Ampelomyces quisqualis TaxID=50730 RepID=A0A6A5Q9P6_AMPQU|nr:pyridoxal phosphate-dependent transferase [Ampelomyces quisqualis]